MFLFCDGFDKYSTIADTSAKGWSISNQGAGSWTFQAAAGVNGGGALQCEQDDQPAIRRMRPVGSALDYIRFAGWFKSGGSPGQSDWILNFEDTTLVQFQGVSVNTAGEIGLVPSSGGISPTTAHISGTTTTGLNLHDGNFHFLEIYLKSENGAGGRFKVKSGSTVYVDFTGDTTAGGGAKMNPDVIRLYTPDTQGIWDDPFVWDDEVGPGITGELAGTGTRVIATTTSDGAGDSTTLTPNTGTNWDAVNDSPFHDGDATYVEGDTTGEKDLYTFTALPLTPVTIDCTVVNAVVKTVAGAECEVDLRVKSVATEDPSAAIAFSNVGYNTIQAAFEQDPDAVAAWTESTLNAAQVGINMVS